MENVDLKIAGMAIFRHLSIVSRVWYSAFFIISPSSKVKGCNTSSFSRTIFIKTPIFVALRPIFGIIHIELWRDRRYNSNINTKNAKWQCKIQKWGQVISDKWKTCHFRPLSFWTKIAFSPEHSRRGSGVKNLILMWHGLPARERGSKHNLSRLGT